MAATRARCGVAARRTHRVATRALDVASRSRLVAGAARRTATRSAPVATYARVLGFPATRSAPRSTPFATPAAPSASSRGLTACLAALG